MVNKFYLKHIFGPIKGRIQILDLNNQEIGFLKIKPFSKTYPLYLHDSDNTAITIAEKRFSSTFDLYLGNEVVESQHIGKVEKKKSATKNVYDFVDAQNKETLRIKSNLSGSKLSVNNEVKMKKKGKHKFLVEIKPETDDSRINIYLAIISYLVLLFDLQNAA